MASQGGWRVGPSRAGERTRTTQGWRNRGLPKAEKEQGPLKGSGGTGTVQGRRKNKYNPWRGLEEQVPSKGRERTGASQVEWSNRDLPGEEKEQGHPRGLEGRGLPVQEREQEQPRGLEEQGPTKGRGRRGASQGERSNRDRPGEGKEQEQLRGLEEQETYQGKRNNRSLPRGMGLQRTSRGGERTGASQRAG